MKHFKLLAISELPFASVSKRVLVHNLCYGNEFDLQDNKRAGKTHFHMKGCAPGLVLKQRQKATRKWPIPPTPQYGVDLFTNESDYLVCLFLVRNLTLLLQTTISFNVLICLRIIPCNPRKILREGVNKP